ncbi:SdpI family protein [Ornithinimicrobium sp. F0845]|uniref:SdpI family protein n=1 Tax=Ornithinimicrobium sp. F0845 TaxID=2926412 RepID=UPI001FF2A747|nr:SdpI family protein [Ornithinimicrobium sp. F0845]MCK0113863.1 SdpI family protein [Ornithinimicrobium sp. F0845]
MLLIVGMALLVLWSMWQLQPDRMVRKGPNAWVGMRSPATVASREAWAAAHRAAWPTARTGCILAIALLIAAAIFAIASSGLSQWEIGSLALGAVTVVMLVTFLIAFRRAERAAESVAAQ